MRKLTLLFALAFALPAVVRADDASIALSTTAASVLFRMGVDHYKGNDMPLDVNRGLALIGKAAQEGDPRAQVWVSLINQAGNSKKGNKLAFKWAEKAAKNGHPVGQMIVGATYLSGQGVRRNPKRALEWTTRAALQGQRDAMLTLAAFYAEGNGVPVDAVETYFWTKLAADRKSVKAIAALRQLQALPEDDRKLGEDRAAVFVPVIERPDLYNEEDLRIPNVQPGIPAPLPVTGASPLPSSTPTPSPSPVK